MLQRAYTWGRGHPQAADGLLGLALLAGSAAQLPRDQPASLAGALILNGMLAILVGLRRREPVVSFAAAAVIVSMQLAFGLGVDGSKGFALTATDFVVVVLLYTLAGYRPRRISPRSRSAWPLRSVPRIWNASAPRRSTRRPRGCGGSNAICTTGRRCGSPRSPWRWGRSRKTWPGTMATRKR